MLPIRQRLLPKRQSAMTLDEKRAEAQRRLRAAKHRYDAALDEMNESEAELKAAKKVVADGE